MKLVFAQILQTMNCNWRFLVCLFPLTLDLLSATWTATDTGRNEVEEEELSSTEIVAVAVGEYWVLPNDDDGPDERDNEQRDDLWATTPIQH